MFLSPVNVDHHVPDLLERRDLRLVQLFAGHFIGPRVLLLSCKPTILFNLLLHINLVTVFFHELVISFFLLALGLVSSGPVDVWRNATDLFMLEAVSHSFADVLVVVNSRLIHVLWVIVVLVVFDRFGMIVFLFDAGNLMVLLLPVHIPLRPLIYVLQGDVVNTCLAVLLWVSDAVFLDDVRR